MVKKNITTDNAARLELINQLDVPQYKNIDFIPSLSPNSFENPKIVAHRGFTPVAPENSLPSFIAAGERKFWGIESDVRKTLDGELIMMHDDSIDRTTNGTGNVSGMTYAEINVFRIDTGNGIGNYTSDELVVPTIFQFLNICRKYGVIPMIELKETGIEEDVVDEIIKHGLENFAIISSTTIEQLQAVRAYNKKISLQLIISVDDSEIPTETIQSLSALGNSGVNLTCTTLANFNQAQLDSLHENGIKASSPRVVMSSDTIIEDIIATGVDYMLTDYYYKIPDTSEDDYIPKFSYNRLRKGSIVDKDGKIGIANSNPEGNLHVKSALFADIPLIERTGTFTNQVLTALKLKSTTYGNMVDEFGTGISFDIQDSANVSNRIAIISVVRSGNDSSGDIVFLPSISGVQTERFRIKSNGVIKAASLPTYADNATALAGSLVAGDIYKTATGELRIVI